MKLGRWSAGIAIAVTLMGSLGAARAVDMRHLALVKSAPAADERVQTVAEVRLWFNQVPQDKATSIRVLDAAGTAVALGDVTPDASDAKVQVAKVPASLPAGTYTVAWRTMSPDGHVVRDQFGFTVAPAR